MTRVAAVLLLVIGTAGQALAQQRFALIVSGATGGEEYAAQYNAWVQALSKTLTEQLRFEPAHVIVLSDSKETARSSTAENVRSSVAAIRQRMKREDLLFVLLIGHGTFDGTDAKFNLVGRDLESSEWSELFRPLAGQIVVVNSTSASFPFLERLSGPRRIVITATDTVAQRFDTVFPEYFVRAFADAAADLDKNGRISVWEAFAHASAGVKRHYRQRGQLATERSLLDDDGDGIGKGAAEAGTDGAQASRTYLDENLPGAAPTDEALLHLLQRKALLEAEVDELKIRRSFLPAEQYAEEFERLMIDLAKVSVEVRRRVKT